MVALWLRLSMPAKLAYSKRNHQSSSTFVSFSAFLSRNASFPSSFDSLDVISGTGQWPHIIATNWTAMHYYRDVVASTATLWSPNYTHKLAHFTSHTLLWLHVESSLARSLQLTRIIYIWGAFVQSEGTLGAFIGHPSFKSASLFFSVVLAEPKIVHGPSPQSYNGDIWTQFNFFPLTVFMSRAKMLFPSQLRETCLEVRDLCYLSADQ